MLVAELFDPCCGDVADAINSFAPAWGLAFSAKDCGPAWSPLALLDAAAIADAPSAAFATDGRDS